VKRAEVWRGFARPGGEENSVINKNFFFFEFAASTYVTNCHGEEIISRSKRKFRVAIWQ